MSSTAIPQSWVPGPDADPRHAQLVELAEQAARLFPEARTVSLHLIVPLPVGTAPRLAADEWMGITTYAPNHPAAPHVTIEERAPLGSTFKPSGEWEETT